MSVMLNKCDNLGYALCTKINGHIVYLNRYMDDKNNSSKLDPVYSNYYFDPIIGDDTLISNAEDWKNFLSNEAWDNILSYTLRDSEWPLRFCFASVERIVNATICNGFSLNALSESPFKVEADIKWDSFC